MIATCNILKCKTMHVIEKVTEYVSNINNYHTRFIYCIVQLLDYKCGCEEGCYYNPGSFIEFTKEATVTMLLQEIYTTVRFLQNVTDHIRDSSMITNPTIPPMNSGDDKNITDPPIPEPDKEDDPPVPGSDEELNPSIPEPDGEQDPPIPEPDEAFD